MPLKTSTRLFLGHDYETQYKAVRKAKDWTTIHNVHQILIDLQKQNVTQLSTKLFLIPNSIFIYEYFVIYTNWEHGNCHDGSLYIQRAFHSCLICLSASSRIKWKRKYELKSLFCQCRPAHIWFHDFACAVVYFWYTSLLFVNMLVFVAMVIVLFIEPFTYVHRRRQSCGRGEKEEKMAERRMARENETKGGWKEVGCWRRALTRMEMNVPV